MAWNRAGFPEYVTVAERKQKIEVRKKKLRAQEKGRQLNPIVISGRSIAQTFWGKTWCTNIESYADYEYRLDRGRNYVRHGAVADLTISAGSVAALVCGTRLYTVNISIAPVQPKAWKKLIAECSGQINSLIELLQGRLSDHIMKIITQPSAGLLPNPGEISFTCSCPDYAVMCKHVAAVLYGIGARLDHAPEDLFLLRSVDHTQLLCNTATQAPFGTSPGPLPTSDLSQLFGINVTELPSIPLVPTVVPNRKTRTGQTTRAAQKQSARTRKKPTT